MSAYLDQAIQNQSKFFLQFGGQGAPYFKELSKYYSSPGFEKFFSIAIEASNRAVQQADASILPCEFNLKEWLSNPESAPDDNTLAVASLSLGLIQVTQFAHFEYLDQQGFSRQKMLEHTVVTSGHSQGLIPAACVALAKQGSAYEEAISLFIEYLFLMGIRAQEVHPYLQATAEETERSEGLGSKNPSPMVAVLGASHSEIETLVQKFNEGREENDKIHVSLYNTPANRIISGFRKSLIDFHEQNQELFAEKQIKYVYLRTTCPFHCPLMIPIREPFHKDIERIGFNYSGADLTTPVISFFDKVNLQQEQSLGKKLCEDLMINTLFWEKSVSGALDAGASHFIDFGPGKTSQRLTADTLSGIEKSAEVHSVANPKDLKVLL